LHRNGTKRRRFYYVYVDTSRWSSVVGRILGQPPRFLPSQVLNPYNLKYEKNLWFLLHYIAKGILRSLLSWLWVNQEGISFLLWVWPNHMRQEAAEALSCWLWTSKLCCREDPVAWNGGQPIDTEDFSSTTSRNWILPTTEESERDIWALDENIDPADILIFSPVRPWVEDIVNSYSDSWHTDVPG
jgi:hypothetical protein